MQRKSFADMSCSVAQCLEVVGEWWTLLIVRDALFGISRFDDFERRLGIARNVLTQRLDKLVELEVFERVAYQDKPMRYDYKLTEKGKDLSLVLGAMRQWGDTWAAPAGPPLTMVHRECGHEIEVRHHCPECNIGITRREQRAKIGPGANELTPLPPSLIATS